MSTNQKPELLLKYEYDFPKEIVFNAFSTKEALGSWWGPVECKNSAVSLDFRPGGTFHFRMEMDGKANYGLFRFKTIQPHDLLEFTNSFADEKGNIVPAPFDIKLPVEIFYRLEFSEQDGRTTITLKGHPVNSSQEEDEVFVSINESMHQGFGATFGALRKFLREG